MARGLSKPIESFLYRVAGGVAKVGQDLLTFRALQPLHRGRRGSFERQSRGRIVNAVVTTLTACVPGEAPARQTASTHVV